MCRCISQWIGHKRCWRYRRHKARWGRGQRYSRTNGRGRCERRNGRSRRRRCSSRSGGWRDWRNRRSHGGRYMRCWTRHTSHVHTPRHPHASVLCRSVSPHVHRSVKPWNHVAAPSVLLSAGLIVGYGLPVSCGIVLPSPSHWSRVHEATRFPLGSFVTKTPS